MKIKLFFISVLISLSVIAQIQIGSDIDGEAASDQSGWSLSLNSDGSIVAIGAFRNDGNGEDSGHVRVYQYLSDNWSQIGTDIDGENIGDFFGISVSLNSNGTIVAISGILNDGNGVNSGHVRIFKNINNVWTQIGSDIDGEAENDRFGTSVSLNYDGNIIAIGGENNNGNGINSGHVRVFQDIDNEWIQIGSDIDGEAENDRSGRYVSLNSTGDILAVGAILNDGNGNNSGHVRVYQNINGEWMQIGLDIDGEAENDQSGRAVSLNSIGNILAIGSKSNDGNGSNSGHVRIYQYINDMWVQIGSDIDGENENNNFGVSVSLNSEGNIIAIGADFNNGNGPFSGHTRIFQNINNNWIQLGLDIDGEEKNDYSGFSVSLNSNGTRVAVSGDLNDGNGIDSGHVRVFDLSALLVLNSFELINTNIIPNPTNNQFEVILNSNIILKKVILYSSLGMHISTSKQNIVDVSKLVPGLYYVEIYTSQGNLTKKILVK